MTGSRASRVVWLVALLSSGCASGVIPAQQNGVAAAPDSATTVAAEGYDAGWLKRFLLGSHYRKLWTAPITVPVLDLEDVGGGLKPEKVGGGFQTRTLRLSSRSGQEYVFRPVRKDSTAISQKFRNTIVAGVLRDATAATHPAGAILADRLLTAAGVLHPHPRLVVMPDDPALGEFQQEFANRLGAIEEFPSKPEEGTGFAGAQEVIESDELLKLINDDGGHQVDARAFLRARLMDMLLNDWDRHPGQWRWARGGALGRQWQPIPRDRDRAFVSFSGVLPRLAGFIIPNATPFRGEPPRAEGLVYNSFGMDRRLLGALDRSEWDSIALDLVHRLTDAVIDAAFASQPVEYQAMEPQLVAQLRARRDGLPLTAAKFYWMVNEVLDVHATDGDDVARVRVSDSGILVGVQSANSGRPYFSRSYRTGDTKEVRLYLHDGDDRAVVTGRALAGIRVRIVGGNGNNTLVDSTDPGVGSVARLYDNGRVSGIQYGPDTLFDRRPWIKRFGKPAPPEPDYGAKVAPVLGLAIDKDIGVIPRIGIAQTTYGFRYQPYARRVELEGEYATRANHGRLRVGFDQRMEDSRLHWLLDAQMSDLEVLRFHGFGNSSQGGADAFFKVDQRQWSLAPSVGYRIGTSNELTLGPIVKYSETHNTANTFIAGAQPYGIGDFGQVGAILRFRLEERDDLIYPTSGLRAEIEASVYPAAWDVESTFGALRAFGMAYFEVPVPTRPVLALRAGGEQVMGDFPFHEAAFLGGGTTVRNLRYQRYAGDAAVHATAELRFRLANVHLLLPLDVGVFPLWETGRVWMDGESPGGWHSAYGGGVWIGLPDPSKSISLSFTNGDFNRWYLKAGLTF